VKLEITEETACLNENELHIGKILHRWNKENLGDPAKDGNTNDMLRLYEETVKVNPAYFTMKSAL
jgi:hypothetical protein